MTDKTKAEGGSEKFEVPKNPYSKFIPLKILLLLTIFSLMILPQISAVEVIMDSSFSSGETLLAKISGNFIDQITRENVFFYRGHVKIPTIYGVVKIEDEFYIYSILTGKTQGNYSLVIEGVRYMRATEVVDDDIILNFTISNETAVFSVNPGVVSTNDDFSLELQNLQDRKINIEIREDSPWIISQDYLELKSGEKKNLLFNFADDSEKGIVNVEFSSDGFYYILPVYLDTNKTAGGKTDFKFQPSVVEVSMATDSDSKRILYISNTGDEPIEDIFFDVSPLLEPYVLVSPENIDELGPNSTEKIEIQITSPEEEAVLEGKITAYAGNLSASLTLVLDFVKDFIPPEGEEDAVIVTTCEELGGTICVESQECTGESAYAKDGVCCLAPAECSEKGGSSTGKWIGGGLLALALIFLYWFYKRRYKKVEKRKAF
ncbi:MAG: hypothetical protein AABW93_01335 [Nanoarchaeota archaeon]